MRDVGAEISEWTVRRRLFQSGLCARQPRKKQRMTFRTVQQRKTWADVHLTWATDNWEKVVFSDETMVSLTLPMSRTVCRSKVCEYLPLCVQQQVKQALTVTIWSAISSKELFPVYDVERIMNAEQY